MREIGVVKYDSSTYSDENMLLNFGIVDPVTLNKNLTYLWGKDSDRFPLLSMTEGNNAISPKKALNGADTQYIWNVAGRMRHTSQVVRLVSTTTMPGRGYTEFEVEMKDAWFIYQFGALSPDGEHQVRIQSEGKPTTNNTFIYRFQLQGGNANEFIPLENFEAGKFWVLGAPTVAASKSDGNRSNRQSTAKATNQFGYHRFSQPITGNIANKVVDIEFDVDGGGTTNLWMPYEMKVFEMNRKQYLEEDLWFSEYNRDAKGVIHLKDPETGEPIPRGSGIKDTLKSVGNYDTYSKLTLERFDSTINRLYDNRIDSTPIEIILYAGSGFAREFSTAIEEDAAFRGYFQAIGDQKVKDGGEYMSYGKYFNQYQTIDGKIVTVKPVHLFNHGLRAEQDRLNGRMYKGLPLSSYTGVFLDHSLNDSGDRNIQLVCEEGREAITGIYKGLTNLPGSWGAVQNQMIATKKDVASYEMFCSQGINMLNPTTSFWMDLALD